MIPCKTEESAVDCVGCRAFRDGRFDFGCLPFPAVAMEIGIELESG
jgi:hypothetical protein